MTTIPTSSKEGEDRSSEVQRDSASLARHKKIFDLSALDDREKYPEARLLKVSTFWKFVDVLNKFLALYELMKSLFHRH
ncbi:MAG: hypothetical protein ACK55B_11570 [Cyanobacteriota bacterium]